MFLCAQARPRWNNATNSWWGGKLGCWPIGRIGVAQRNSANRPRGTPIWENINITRALYRSTLIEKLLPAIEQKWPLLNTSAIHIQQDGTRSHIYPHDAAFCTAVEEKGLNLELYTQPANSPDLNLLDLGFFRAIQSYNDVCPKDEFELISAVENAFDAYPREKINRIWLTLQGCMNSIIDDSGNNNYKIPHMGKERLENLGQLPTVLDATDRAAKYLLDGLE